METEGLLQHSQQPATCPYPQPDRSSPYPSSHSSKIYFNIILPSTPESSKLSPSLRFFHQNTVCTSPFPILTTCPAHLSRISGKGKGFPLQACSGCWGSRRLRHLDLLDFRRYEGGSHPYTPAAFTPRSFPGTHF